MSQSLLYLEKRQLLRAAPVFIVVFSLPGQLRIFYANGRTIIHCPINVKQKMTGLQIYFEKQEALIQRRSRTAILRAGNGAQVARK
ncbi:hypothetical protein PQR63_00030 [Herbaspirillum rhizosphaerae]|uniref:Uncharacterized protein n=1 Tax=Herbaspirillum rhizosphaerae TaxID=346179 RepID=A0ABW8Z341_9BURK